ncbi:hypothetical protein [Streptomyces sp. MBT33]|uniref:hypothetical protein n=1 Tax=Streptomyces sp. MBT33 TaxID=1488363 RepID=UPI00190A9247|nr:hypothetical protein [Streptomyces sp. MBT33]MBK3644477.1 hypothetical protein [Streptomyces sp. MBT33]
MSRKSTADGVRVKRRTPFVIIESATVRDTRLSYRELGLLTYLLDQSEDWQVRSEQLSQGEGREGRDAVRKSLHRLAVCGYYRLERRRFRNGKTAMGTAISDHPVTQWAADYETFGKKLDIPVVEQEDGTFRVKYADGTLGSDGFDADADGAEPPVDHEPEESAAEEEPRRPAPAVAAAVPPAKPSPKKDTETPTKTAEEKEAEAAQKAAEKALLDADAEEVAKWWWAEAETRFGKYVGDKRAYIAMRKQVRNALEKDYTKNQCGRALIRAGKHWPSAQQWQDALGVVTNHIQPRQANGRVPYSDGSTWGLQNDGPASVPGDTGAPPSTPIDDADDATFGVLVRP